MFKKILVANRGEIACRVIRSAARLGIGTVAVHSEADRDAEHVRMADEAVCVGPPPSAESYLDLERIVQACRTTGAEAVHPGYGFLSENAAFAERLAEEGIVFIGPPPEAMRLMGDKISSKRLAAEAGVSTIPGSEGALSGAGEAMEEARRIGYPVMLKASAGGGGKGMRVARSEEDCREAFDRAAGEALSSFGDDRILIEKYIESPRHIEIQVIADGHGTVLHLGERECSLQRRHQKVIEESPSPFIDEATREAMGAQAVALARAVGYVSAGTVEFVVDPERNFYFLEMNTRLQVEHPVTEFVTGLDLVELMIRIAGGEKLGLLQEDVRLQGWSMEARVYAEDPFRGFLPSPGRLVHYLPPEESPNLRVDSGVTEGSAIPIYYDPMIAKLITHGATRGEAALRMHKALDEFLIRGVENNIAFLSALISHPRFLEGNITTTMIAEEYPDGFHPADAPHDEPELIAAVAASIHRRYFDCNGRISGQLRGYEKNVRDRWTIVTAGTELSLTVVPAEGGHDVTIGDRLFAVRTDWTFGRPLFRGTVNGDPVCVQVERRDAWYRLTHSGSQVDVLVLRPAAGELFRFMPEKRDADHSSTIRSPMPGLLISVDVEAGQRVKAGEKVAVVEAMKMENTLFAEQEGTIAAVLASPGDNLVVDQPIVEFET
jgi:propionyl-CoA carboxylase alpha chain